jgi:hypothetical protein
LGLEETRLQGVEARLQLLAMGMGHEDGLTKKNDMDECDKGEEMNLMEQVSNNGEKIFRLFFFFFYSYGVIHRSEECCSAEIPKFLTRKKCVFTWQPEHSCTVIDLVSLICLC